MSKYRGRCDTWSPLVSYSGLLEVPLQLCISALAFPTEAAPSQQAGSKDRNCKKEQSRELSQHKETDTVCGAASETN